MAFYRSHVLVCADPECLSKGAHEVVDALQDEFIAQGLIDEIQVLETSRIGGCAGGPEMMVYPEGIHYVGMTPDDIPYLVEEHFLKGRIVDRFREVVKPIVDEELGPLRPKEVRVVLRNCGQIDPNNIEDYLATDGYQALGQALFEMTPEQVIAEVLNSGLRGRGGAGFPAAKKWAITRAVPDSPKYMICNGLGEDGDIERLETLCHEVSRNSLCGLGQGAPVPVVSTLRNFRHEYEAHIYEKRCPAEVCRPLIRMEIQEPICTGCTVCARNCPVDAIHGEHRQVHHIDPNTCIKCGICVQVCNFNAIAVESLKLKISLMEV